MEYEFVTKDDPIAACRPEVFDERFILSGYKTFRFSIYSQIRKDIRDQINQELMAKLKNYPAFLNTPTVFVRRDNKAQHMFSKDVDTCNVFITHGCTPLIVKFGVANGNKVIVTQGQDLTSGYSLCFVGRAYMFGSKIDLKDNFVMSLDYAIDNILFDFAEFIASRFKDFLDAYISALILAKNDKNFAQRILSTYSISLTTYKSLDSFVEASEDLYNRSYQQYQRNFHLQNSLFTGSCYV